MAVVNKPARRSRPPTPPAINAPEVPAVPASELLVVNAADVLVVPAPKVPAVPAPELGNAADVLVVPAPKVPSSDGFERLRTKWGRAAFPLVRGFPCDVHTMVAASILLPFVQPGPGRICFAALFVDCFQVLGVAFPICRVRLYEGKTVPSSQVGSGHSARARLFRGLPTI